MPSVFIVPPGPIDYRALGRGFAEGMRDDAEGRGTPERFLAHRDPKFGHQVIEGGLLAVAMMGATADDIAEWHAGFSEVVERGVEQACP
jgi:hypothetical protein